VDKCASLILNFFQPPKQTTLHTAEELQLMKDLEKSNARLERV